MKATSTAIQLRPATDGAALYRRRAIPQAQVAGNTIGFPYASFLLGLVNNGERQARLPRSHRQAAVGFYAQDTWKITRKLTLDYGLRYDYSTYFKEQYGRMANLAPNLPNPHGGRHSGRRAI